MIKINSSGKWIVLFLSFMMMPLSAMAETVYRMSIPARGMSDTPAVIPPGFWYPWTTGTLRNTYPAFGDASSWSDVSFDVNFGQKPFKGEMPKEYLPYDPAYSTSKWTGNIANISGSVITPTNLGTITYSIPRNSGRYYFEVTANNTHVGLIGFLPKPAGGQLDRISGSQGIAVGNYLGKIYDIRNSKIWYPSWNDRFTIQVYVDYDNDRVSFRVLGTEASAYPSAIH